MRLTKITMTVAGYGAVSRTYNTHTRNPIAASTTDGFFIEHTTRMLPYMLHNSAGWSKSDSNAHRRRHIATYHKTLFNRHKMGTLE